MNFEKLATGGMAEVYLAKSNQGHNNISKFIAIKRILPQFAENPEFLDMFRLEARIAVNLSHSNIVAIYDFGVEKRQPFLVMDYVEGRNLRQVLNRMKKGEISFSIEQALYIIREVAAGLDHAHRCLDGTTGKPLNITHRDISPQNVMVSFEGEVKVVDFGIAKAESQLEVTRAGTLKGKFGYMSPEQAEGHPVDLRTDIFSLGIAMWELLANDRLFIAKDETQTLRKIRECQVPPLRKINPSIPQELERICNKALAKDRNLRYQTAADFHRDLSRFLNRQYPDFSPHDFSLFIKNLFSSEILDARRKQIEYSRLTEKKILEPEVVDFKTEITNTNTRKTETDADVPQQPIDLTPSSPEEVDAPFFSPKPGDAARTDNIPMPSSKKRIPPPMPQPAQRTAKVGSNTSPKLQIEKPRESTFTGSYSPRSNDIQFAQNRSYGAFYVLAIVAGILGYYAYTSPTEFQKHAYKLAGQVGIQLPRNFTVQEHQTEQASSAPVARTIVVKSQPSGAEITVDAVPFKDLTPASVEVPLNQEVQITVRLPGYVPVTKTFAARSAERELAAQLIRAKLGYVDISVIGSGAIYIDGVKVKDAGPVTNYPIAADQNVIVRVYDTVTKSEDSTVVRVPENRVKRVTLMPRMRGRNNEPERNPSRQ